MSWRSTTHEITVELALDAAGAREVCGAAAASLGEVESGAAEGGLLVREDPAGLCCVIWPVEVEIDVREDAGRARVHLTGTIPGRGPLQRRQLRDRLGRLAREISDRSA